MKKYQTLGQLLTDYREVFGISQADLAAMVDVDVRTVQRWEADVTQLKDDKEADLVRATFLPHQLVRNLNSITPIPTWYDFSLRKYSLSELSNDLPDARTILENIYLPSERVRTLRPDADLETVIQYLFYRNKERKGIRTAVIREAVNLLPGLNLFVTDEAGFYAGHVIVMPLKKESYLRIRERQINPDQLSFDDLADHRTAHHPYFFQYSIAADSNDNICILVGAIMRFMKAWNDKPYTWCTITDRYDSYYLHTHVGLKVVWEDKEHRSVFGDPYRFVEGDFREFLSDA